MYFIMKMTSCRNDGELHGSGSPGVSGDGCYPGAMWFFTDYKESSDIIAKEDYNIWALASKKKFVLAWYRNRILQVILKEIASKQKLCADASPLRPAKSHNAEQNRNDEVISMDPKLKINSYGMLLPPNWYPYTVTVYIYYGNIMPNLFFMTAKISSGPSVYP